MGFLLILLATTYPLAMTETRDQILGAADLAKFENPPADARIRYGDDPLQFGDLRLPPGDGPHPVAVFIHGGCWLAEYDITHSSALTAALARNGIASCSLEYHFEMIDPDSTIWPLVLEAGRELLGVAGE